MFSLLQTQHQQTTIMTARFAKVFGLGVEPQKQEAIKDKSEDTSELLK